MSVSSVASSAATQIQPAAPKKMDNHSKVEGNKPDGDKDADDKAGAVQQNATASVTATATTGNIGRNINVVA